LAIVARKKAILVGVEYSGKNSSVLSSLEELEQLALTAGMVSVLKLIQKRTKPDPGFFIGHGKSEEIKGLCIKKNADYVIFNDELTPTQQKNLEGVIPAAIMDRTRLILNIFAGRAHTQEAKLQVELARTYYHLPRLKNSETSLSQQTGAIGVRAGFGEKKLEVDKRKIRDRIASLKKEILKIKHHREIQRSKRQELPIPVIAIVGYTNVGKSTLLNKLTGTDSAYADNRLFATLDTTARRVKLPGGKWVIFVDTVGFINKLPHNLIAAFKSTLEEINSSDLILHLMDASDIDYAGKEKIVISVLDEIGAGSMPVIGIFNKCDTAEHKNIERRGCFCISAKTGEGIDKLLSFIEQKLENDLEYKKISIPLASLSVVDKIKSVGKILSYKMSSGSAEIEILIDKKNWGQIKKQLPDISSS